MDSSTGSFLNWESEPSVHVLESSSRRESFEVELGEGGLAARSSANVSFVNPPTAGPYDDADRPHTIFLAEDALETVPSSSRQGPQLLRGDTNASLMSEYASGSFLNSFDLFDERTWTLERLQLSWSIFFLRAYHGLCFVFAIVMIAGVAINSEVNLFLEFFESATEGSGARFTEKRIFTPEAWVNIIATTSTAALLLMFYSGISLRGYWLLLDGTRVDMFKNYRRTLCCEGSGPGCFQNHYSNHVTVTSKEDLKEVHRHLDGKGKVTHEFTLGGHLVIAGSQLLALNAMKGKDDRDALLDLDPSQPGNDVLVFHEDRRPIDINANHQDWAFIRGVWDMVTQFVLFLTVDFIPMFNAFAEIFETGLTSTRWIETLMTSSVQAAIWHAFWYYAWSSTMEYVWKVLSFRVVLTRLRELRGLESEAQDDHESPARAPRTMRTRMRKSLGAYTHKVRRNFDMETIVGRAKNPAITKRGFDKRDSTHNICVFVHNFSRKALREWPVARAIFFGLGLLSILTICLFSNTEFVHNFRMFFWVIGFSSIVALWRFDCVPKLREKLKAFQEKRSISNDTMWNNAELLKAKWFQIYCSIDGMSAVLKAALYFFAGLLLVSRGAYKAVRRLIVMGVMLFIASGVLSVFALRHSRNLWMVVLCFSLFNFIIILWSSYSRYGHSGFWQNFMLCLLTQLGLTRQSKHKRPVLFFSALFSSVIAIVGLVTTMATFKDDGTSFGERPGLWCTGEPDDVCDNFVFPVNGTRRSYQLCNLGWSMGPKEGIGEASLLTSQPEKWELISDRCNDTKLSVSDFAAFANLPYLLPDEEAVKVGLQQDFPGWKVTHIQKYNASLRHYTTFAHLTRGSTHIIAVRGTWSAIESLHDLNYWLPAGFIQTAQRLGPAILDTTLFMQRIASFAFLRAKKTQFRDVLQYANETMRTLPRHHLLYMTGHSLGGGLAQIVGALVGVPAIVFSSPGLLATSYILSPSPSLKDLMIGSVNIIPEKDLVPEVDEQVGSEMRIRCSGRSYDCHSLSWTMCELLASCGDGRAGEFPRKFLRSCDMCGLSGHTDDIAECNKKSI